MPGSIIAVVGTTVHSTDRVGSSAATANSLGEFPVLWTIARVDADRPPVIRLGRNSMSAASTAATSIQTT